MLFTRLTKLSRSTRKILTKGQHFVSTAVTCWYTFVYSEAVLGLLKNVAEQAPRHLTDQTLPLLFASLPENPPGLEALADREKCWRILSILRKLCIQQALFEVMVVRLLAKIDYLCFSSGVHGDDLEPAQAYSHMILKTLAETLRTKINNKNVDVVKYIDSLVPHIFNVFVVSAFHTGDRKVVAADSRLVKVAGEIITSVVQSLPISSVFQLLSWVWSWRKLHRRQQTFCVGLNEAILKGNFADIAQGFQRLPTKEGMPVFSVGYPELLRRYV